MVVGCWQYSSAGLIRGLLAMSKVSNPITLSPFRKPLTSPPTSSIIPLTSQPKMAGYPETKRMSWSCIFCIFEAVSLATLPPGTLIRMTYPVDWVYCHRMAFDDDIRWAWNVVRRILDFQGVAEGLFDPRCSILRHPGLRREVRL